MVMRGKAFLAFLAFLVLIISFSLVAALPCGHISLYVHRMAMCTKKIQWTLWAFTSFAFNGNPVDSLVSDPTSQSTVDTGFLYHRIVGICSVIGDFYRGIMQITRA
jgi:hypothetical protein